MNRNFLIAGNWKMNCLLDDAKNLAESVKKNSENKKPEIALFPNSIYLLELAKILKGSKLKTGAQDCSFNSKGAYTGETSAEMLKDAGCEYVILGHSERRSYHNESCPIINKKAVSAHAANIKTIICVGESLDKRKASEHFNIVKKQLELAIPDCATPENTIIAYEPIWAIGTGISAEALQISEMHSFIRKETNNNYKILYGGSVKAQNSKEILEIHDVDGVLVGGASIIASEFNQIIDTADKLSK